jgi:hypothetical protein
LTSGSDPNDLALDVAGQLRGGEGDELRVRPPADPRPPEVHPPERPFEPHRAVDKNLRAPTEEDQNRGRQSNRSDFGFCYFQILRLVCRFVYLFHNFQ